jgi:hypothetical protein
MKVDRHSDRPFDGFDELTAGGFDRLTAGGFDRLTAGRLRAIYLTGPSTSSGPN